MADPRASVGEGRSAAPAGRARRSTARLEDPRARPRHPAEEATDQALLAAYADGGDEAIFARLVERHGALVLAACQRVLRHRHDAEDAAQAVLIALSHQAASLRDHPSLPGWLCRTAWHVSTRLARTRARRVRRERHGLHAARGLHQPPAGDDAGMRLERALHALPEPQRLALIMHHLEGRTLEDIATASGCTPSAISMRLTRAKARLRALLGGEEASLIAVLQQASHALVSRPDALRVAHRVCTAPASRIRQALSLAREGRTPTTSLIVGGSALLVLVLVLVLMGVALLHGHGPAAPAVPAVAAEAPEATATPRVASAHPSASASALPVGPIPAVPTVLDEDWSTLVGLSDPIHALHPTCMTLDADGRLWIGGYAVAYQGGTGARERGFVACLSRSGVVPFDGAGHVELPVQRVLQIEATPDHHLIVLAARPEPILLRLDRTCHPDATFADHGTAVLPLDPVVLAQDEDFADPAHVLLESGRELHRPALAMDHQGRLLVAGSNRGSPELLTLSARGVPDLALGLNRVSGAYLRVSVTPQDDLLATGYALPGPHVLLARFPRDPRRPDRRQFVHAYEFDDPAVGVGVLSGTDDGILVAGEVLRARQVTHDVLPVLDYQRPDGTDDPNRLYNVVTVEHADHQALVRAWRASQDELILALQLPSIPCSLVSLDQQFHIAQGWLGDGAHRFRDVPGFRGRLRDLRVGRDGSIWLLYQESSQELVTFGVQHLLRNGKADPLFPSGPHRPPGGAPAARPPEPDHAP